MRLASLCADARAMERATTSIAYALIALLVAIGFLAGLKALGDGNSASWGATSNKITGAMKNAGPMAQRPGGRRLAGSPVGNSTVPSASASRTVAVPGASGRCWLSCGAQAVKVMISKVAGTRPVESPKRSR